MSDRLFVATRKGLFRLERRTAGDWSVGAPSFRGDPIITVLPDPRDGTVYAAPKPGHFGAKFWASADGGATFQERAVPEYPPRPEGHAPEEQPFGRPALEWKLEQVWTLETGGTDEPGVLWAGTIPGGLFRSPDGGRSWTFIRSLWDRPERRKWMGGGYDHPGIHSIVVDPRDARHVTIAISCGGVWETRDSGATWEMLGKGLRQDYSPPEHAYDPTSQDAHLLSACRASPDHMWIQHHNGIFGSTDGGRNWTEFPGVQPSVFGFAVAAHPKQSGKAWFVPAVKDEFRFPVDGRMSVTVTEDGGKSWRSLTRGLPERDCYDLVYRHGLAVDGTGQRLAMGSTTGGLWISEDGGESWTQVPARLPPVYCVRFG